MIEIDNIVLRPLQKEDLEKLFVWRNDLDLLSLTLGVRLPKCKEQEESWYANLATDYSNKNIFFGITTDSKENIVGIIQANNIDYISRTCNLGLFIGDEKARGKGIGKKSLLGFIDYLFNYINIRKIILNVISYNQQAISLYESIGFIKEGVLKDQCYWNDSYHDILIYSLFKMSK